MHGHCVEAVDREAYAALEGRPWHDHVHDATRTHVLHGVTTTQRERTFSTGYSSTANRTGCVGATTPLAARVAGYASKVSNIRDKKFSGRNGRAGGHPNLKNLKFSTQDLTHARTDTNQSKDGELG